MAKKTLLFGNGINRTEGSASWDKILGNVFSGEKQLALEEQDGEKVPATLVYESLLAKEIKRKRDDKHTEEYCAKQAFVSKINSSNGALFNTIANLNFDEYMTTNYDYSLEDCLMGKGYSKEKEKNSSLRSSRFSLQRKVVCKKDNREIKVWHIHGEKGITHSVMLGYDQYCRYLRKIELYVLGLGKNHEMSMKDKLGKKTRNDACWVDLFFFTDVYIVGLGLGYSEIELWWLLCFRSRLNPGNRIYFYDKGIDCRRKSVLESLGVEVNCGVEEIDSGVEWREWYEKVFDVIGENVNAR